jgi:outer membrane receptor for monomeric catechols
LPSTPATAGDNQLGLFAQDDWTLDQHWTLNLGLRWDYESNMFDNKFVTPAGIVTALQNYTNWTAAGIDYRNYVSTGRERKAYKGAFQPRLGVSYDVNGDRDLVFFGGWGRYYDRTTFLAAQIERIKDTLQNVVTLPTTSTDINAIRTAALATNYGGEVWLLNNNAKVPYSASERSSATSRRPWSSRISRATTSSSTSAATACRTGSTRRWA